MTFKGTTPPAISADKVFFGCDALRDIYVPTGSGAAYRTATSSYQGLSSLIREDLSGAVITFASTAYPYTGSPIEPSVEVLIGEEALTPDRDYELSCADNVSPGKAVVTATAMPGGAYAGSVSASFTITKQGRAAPAAPALASKTATSVTLRTLAGAEYRLGGAAWQASPVFTGLAANTTFVFYQRYKETATQFASPSSRGLSVTTDKPPSTADKPPAIKDDPPVKEKIDLSAVSVTAADKVWTGRKLTSGFAIKANGKKLSAGVDYRIAGTGANKNIGKGTVRITGKGDYKNTVEVAFKIVPKAAKVKSVKPIAKSLSIKWSAAPKAEKITKYEVRWKVKGTKRWSNPKTVKVAKPALTIKKLKKGKRYEVQVRVCKTVKGAKYYSEWSAAKTSGKVK
jgi:hypothetical protein